MTPDEKALHAAMQDERRHLVSLAYSLLGSVNATKQAIHFETPAQARGLCE